MKQSAKKKCIKCGVVQPRENFMEVWFSSRRSGPAQRVPTCAACVKKKTGKTTSELIAGAIEKATEQALDICEGRRPRD